MKVNLLSILLIIGVFMMFILMCIIDLGWWSILVFISVTILSIIFTKVMYRDL